MVNSKDLVGRQFGRWTVLEDTKYVKNRERLLCRCQCGKERYVEKYNLLSGKSISCGCLSAEYARGRLRDLRGEKFGRLTVLARAQNRNGNVYWKCRCSCGNEVEVSSKQLCSGKTRSCGCLRKEKTIENHGIRDLHGYTSGYLVALSFTNKRNKKGSVVWHCVCTRCGKRLDLTEDELTHGNYVSCGCYRKEINAKIGDTLHFVDNTCVEWLENRKHRRDNKSGFRGVNKYGENKYKANIGFRKKRYYLGTYDSYDQAVEARMEAEAMLHDAFVSQYKEWQRKSGQDSTYAKEHPFKFEAGCVATAENKILAKSAKSQSEIR